MKNIFLTLFIFTVFIINISAQTQAEMTETAYKNYDKTDKELNKMYNQVLNVLDSDGKSLLIKAEKDWISFRDSHCEFEASLYEGGSIQPLIRATCLDEQTQKRINDLKNILD